MNKDAANKMLADILKGMIYTDRFFKEIIDLVSKSSKANLLRTMLMARLRVLMELGYQVTELKEFENIGSGLYSMHLTGQDFNYRILFGFLPDQRPVLLLAFHERAKKKKTDYSLQIQPALERFKSAKEDYENGYI